MINQAGMADVLMCCSSWEDYLERVPAGQPHDKETYGHHITFVPVVFNIELQLFQDAGVLIREETLNRREQREITVESHWMLSRMFCMRKFS